VSTAGAFFYAYLEDAFSGFGPGTRPWVPGPPLPFGRGDGGPGPAAGPLPGFGGMGLVRLLWLLELTLVFPL